MRYLLITFLVFASIDLIGQDRIDELRTQLEELAREDAPGLLQEVNVAVPNTSVKAFIGGIGRSHELNVLVDPGIQSSISANFKNETVLNVFLFICKNYNLTIEQTGTILHFKAYQTPRVVQPKKEIEVLYDDAEGLISYDLNQDTLQNVVRKIVQLTGSNIVLSPEVHGQLVNGFVATMGVKEALQEFTFANDLSLETLENGIYRIRKKAPQQPNARQQGRDNKEEQAELELQIDLGVNGEVFVSLQAQDQSLSDILSACFEQANQDYIMYEQPVEKITTVVELYALDDFLGHVLTGTSFTYKNLNGLYLFGDRNNEGLRSSELVQLKYRSVKELVTAIPPQVTGDVQIMEFPELNSLIVSGGAPNITEIKEFISHLDRPVPMITIELMIIDVKKTKGLSTGISAGLADGPVETSGTILPGLDVTFGAGSINDLLSDIGLANLGQVTPNFYVSLRALETNGNIDISSTPRLATLNGHAATLNIGQTDYYLEQNQNIFSNQNTQTVITNQYKSVQADFTINIDPIVSGDEHVTLDITVDQSDFTARIAPDAPPGTATRKFESIIRVRNGEMIMLGGLERVAKNETGSGLPVLARIPVLKWFFSNREKTKEKSKLLLFIKPTITY